MKVSDLYQRGIRVFFDPSLCSHDKVYHQRRDISQLQLEPPVYTGDPVVLVVVVDVAFVIHRAHAEAVPHLLAALSFGSHRVLHIWNQKVPVLSVCPPHSYWFQVFVTRELYGCTCTHCAHASTKREFLSLVDYMQCGEPD